MGEDILGVLESLGHFCVGAFKSCRERVVCSGSCAVYVSDHFILRGKEDFCFILERHLDDFVRESKHNCVLSFHPLFHIHVGLIVRWILLGIDLHVLSLHLFFEVAFKVGKESDFLLHFSGVIFQVELLHEILSVIAESFNVFNVV